jgi:thiol:disulfide interchange protein DsbA
MKLAVSTLFLASVLLAGCGSESPPTEAAPSPTAATPAAAPAPTAAPEAPAATAPAPIADAAPAAAPTPAQSEPAASAAPAAAGTIAAPSGPEPREGVDYTLIDPPAPFAPSPGKIEVAEVFAYYCIHCATLQARVTPWKAALPADVEFRYVPMAHGSSEPFARAFYAAEAMGEHERTHVPMFKAIAEERRFKSGSAEDVAALFAETGVDRDALLSTMRSFAVNAQIARNQKAVARWAIEATPTFVVNGRYRATVAPDRGHDGLLSTVEHLIARERAAAGTPSAP